MLVSSLLGEDLVLAEVLPQQRRQWERGDLVDAHAAQDLETRQVQQTRHAGRARHGQPQRDRDRRRLLRLRLDVSSSTSSSSTAGCVQRVRASAAMVRAGTPLHEVLQAAVARLAHRALDQLDDARRRARRRDRPEREAACTRHEKLDIVCRFINHCGQLFE